MKSKNVFENCQNWVYVLKWMHYMLKFTGTWIYLRRTTVFFNDAIFKLTKGKLMSQRNSVGIQGTSDLSLRELLPNQDQEQTLRLNFCLATACCQPTYDTNIEFGYVLQILRYSPCHHLPNRMFRRAAIVNSSLSTHYGRTFKYKLDWSFSKSSWTPRHRSTSATWSKVWNSYCF